MITLKLWHIIAIISLYIMGLAIAFASGYMVGLTVYCSENKEKVTDDIDHLIKDDESN